MRTDRMFVIALAGVLAIGPALAGDGKGKHKAYHGTPGKAVHVIDNDGRHDNGLHKGWYKQAWKRGDRIPLAYVEPVYVVRDYRVYQLSAPPAGYQWVRPMDDRYLLVNLATGLVAEALGY